MGDGTANSSGTSAVSSGPAAPEGDRQHHFPHAHHPSEPPRTLRHDAPPPAPRRTDGEIAEANSVGLGELRDPQTDAERVVDPKVRGAQAGGGG